MTKEKLAVFVISDDQSVVCPLVCGVFNALLQGRLQLECRDVEVSVTPVYRKAPEEGTEVNPRVAFLLGDWADEIDLDEVGFADRGDLTNAATKVFGPPVLLDDLNELGLYFDCDAFESWGFVDFMRDASRSKMLATLAQPVALGLLHNIANHLFEEYSHGFGLYEHLITRHTDFTKAPKQESIESMREVVLDIDLGLVADQAVLEAVLRRAGRDLFLDKPLNEWNLWLLRCLTTGILAHAPEVATMWQELQEQEKQTPSKD